MFWVSLGLTETVRALVGWSVVVAVAAGARRVAVSVFVNRSLLEFVERHDFVEQTLFVLAQRALDADSLLVEAAWVDHDLVLLRA